LCLISDAGDINSLNRTHYPKGAVKKILLCLLLSFLFFFSSHAATLKNALNGAAEYFAKTAIKIDPQKKIYIRIADIHNQQQDQVAKTIETELYFALESQFADFKLFLEPAEGNDILMFGTYEKQGTSIEVRLQAFRQDKKGEILGSIAVSFESEEKRRRTLVAVLDLETEIMDLTRRKAYSEYLRSKLINIHVFDDDSTKTVNITVPV
jgi:hypothetical protein